MVAALCRAGGWVSAMHLSPRMTLTSLASTVLAGFRLPDDDAGSVVPLAVGAFGNYVVPLQIGAPDMAFPKLNMMSYWMYLPGGLLMLLSFFLPGGAPNSGWTSYPPLSIIATQGQTIWIIGMIFLITSSLLGSINFIVTIFQLRAKGLSFMRLPFFVWAQLVTSYPSGAATWTATGVVAVGALGAGQTMTVTAYAVCTV